MKIVITGGLGFIGQTLAHRLLVDGHDLTLADNLSAQIHGDLPRIDAPQGAHVARIDVRDLPALTTVLEGSDAVFHFAAETGTAQSMYRIRHYVDVNEMGTACLLEAIAACTRRPRRLILASSRSVYGEGAYLDTTGRLMQPAPRGQDQLAAGQWEHRGEDGAPLRPVPTPESMYFAPGSVYAATKASQELLVTSAAQALGLQATILRLQNVYGEGQSLRNPYTGIISIFFNRARQDLAIPIYEDGLESRDFVHVLDVVAAFHAALMAEVPSGCVINVGSGVLTSVGELARALLSAAGLSVPIEVTGQYRVGDIRHCYADITRMREVLGVAPQTTLQQGLARFCQWAHGQPVHADHLDAATEELRKKGLARA